VDLAQLSCSAVAYPGWIFLQPAPGATSLSRDLFNASR